MPEPSFDLQRAHRWFAVELNNLAWNLVEAPGRTPDQAERMIHAAHGACHHWLQVGAPINHLRALCLLATAYASAGDGVSAMRWSRQCLALTEANHEGQTTFDQATAYGCAAHAEALCGKRDEARRHYEQALAAAARFEEPDDRAVFEKLYPALGAPS